MDNLLQQLFDWYTKQEEEKKRLTSPPPTNTPLGMRAPTVGEKIKNAILGGLDSLDQQPLSELLGMFSPIEQMKDTVKGGDPLGSAEAGPAKAIISGAAMPKRLWHGTRAPGGAQQLVDEGVDKGKWNITDIIGGAFHSTPNRYYATEFAIDRGDPKYMLPLEVDPDSTVLPITNASEHTLLSTSWPEETVREIKDPRHFEDVEKVARVFGINTNDMKRKVNDKLENALKTHPDVLKEFGIDHVLYDDGMYPALATVNLGKLKEAETGRPLFGKNDEKYQERLWNSFRSGPVKKIYETAPFDSMKGRYTFDADKMRVLEEGTGSNPGAKVEIPELTHLNKMYVKSPLITDPLEAERIVQNELGANIISDRLDDVREERVAHPARWKGRPAFINEWINGYDANLTDSSSKARELAKAILLRNWDVAEPGNLKIHKNYGTIRSIDLGGALHRRAQGQLKPGDFRTDIGELDTLLNPSINPNAARMFQGVQLGQLEPYFDQYGIFNSKLRANLSDTTSKLSKIGMPSLLEDVLVRNRNISEELARRRQKNRIVVPSDINKTELQQAILTPSHSIDNLDDLVDDAFTNWLHEPTGDSQDWVDYDLGPIEDMPKLENFVVDNLDDYNVDGPGMNQLHDLWNKYHKEDWWLDMTPPVNTSITASENAYYKKWHQNILDKLKSLGLEP